MIKGIATPEDARIAAELGVEYIWVSNHGGRQLDHGRGAIDVLEEIMTAVDGKARFIIDGGFLRGTDIVKAMAMGVEAVAVGRLYCYALAAAVCEPHVFSAFPLLGLDDPGYGGR